MNRSIWDRLAAPYRRLMAQRRYAVMLEEQFKMMAAGQAEMIFRADLRNAKPGSMVNVPKGMTMARACEIQADLTSNPYESLFGYSKPRRRVAWPKAQWIADLMRESEAA